MKKNKLPNIVSTAILTLIVIFSWIVFSVLRVFTIKPSPPVPAEILKPVDADLDTNSLNTLENRIFFERGTETPIPQVSPLP